MTVDTKEMNRRIKQLQQMNDRIELMAKRVVAAKKGDISIYINSSNNLAKDMDPRITGAIASLLVIEYEQRVQELTMELHALAKIEVPTGGDA